MKEQAAEAEREADVAAAEDQMRMDREAAEWEARSEADILSALGARLTST